MSISDVEALHRQVDAQRERIQALEEQIRLICRLTGVPCNLDLVEVPDDVRQLAAAGDRLGAVRRYRELAGCDLPTAQKAIDSI